MSKTIVKVEMPPRYFNEVDQQEPALVYAKGRKGGQHLVVDEKLRGAMGHALKKFWFASIDDAGSWQLIEPAPWQGW